MKRWAICKMGDYDGDGSRTPAFNKYPCNSRIWSIQSKGWALGQFSIADLTAISADPDIHILPDATLDAAWSSIPANVRNRVTNALDAAGFTSQIQNNWTVRQVLAYIVNQLQPGVSVESGDVPDIEQ